MYDCREIYFELSAHYRQPIKKYVSYSIIPIALATFVSVKIQLPFPIIGVGGIHSSEDAIEKLDAGAVLIQIYTGFIYEGPFFVKRINKALLKR